MPGNPSLKVWEVCTLLRVWKAGLNCVGLNPRMYGRRDDTDCRFVARASSHTAYLIFNPACVRCVTSHTPPDDMDNDMMYTDYGDDEDEVLKTLPSRETIRKFELERMVKFRLKFALYFAKLPEIF